MAAPACFEDQVKWRFTRCLNDIIIKSMSTKGALIVGIGGAIGMSYQNCEREMKLALTSPCEKQAKKQSDKGDCPFEEEANGGGNGDNHASNGKTE